MSIFLGLPIAGATLFIEAFRDFSWQLCAQKDDRVLDPQKRDLLELKVQEFAQKLEINKPIEVSEKTDLGDFSSSRGMALFSGRAGIVVDPAMAYGISESTLEFTLAR